MPNQTTIGTFPNPFNLQSLDGLTGFIIPGLNPGDYFGQKISGIRDFNGDGVGDFIACSLQANSYTGQCILLFGKAGVSFPRTFNLADIDSTTGIIFNGANIGDLAGFSVNDLGDVNGDGISDLGIGASRANSVAGKVYIIYGSRTGLATIYNLANSDVTISGTIPNQPLNYINGVGDVNGDRIDDLVVANLVAGKFYLLFGKAGGLSTTINLASLGSNGVTFSLSSGSSSASSVVGVGDVTGDGYNDFLIATPAIGTVFLVRGIPNFSSSNNLNNLNGTTGTRFVGSATYYTGHSVSGVGNIYGNNTKAFLVGESGTTVDTYSGKVYLINSQVGGYPALVDFTSPINATVTVFNGVNSQDHAGTSVKGVGDYNYDGLNDWAVCTANSNSQLAGKCYVIFGSPNGYANQDNFGSLSSGSKGITFTDISLNTVAGISIAANFDFNDDGVPDIGFGDQTALPDQLGTYQGQCYMPFGKNNLFPTPSTSPTPSITKTPTNTMTSSITSSSSITATYTQTPSQTPSVTVTSTQTPSITPSMTPTSSETASRSVTPSVSPSHQVITVQIPDSTSSAADQWKTALGIASAGVGMLATLGGLLWRWHSARKKAAAKAALTGNHDEHDGTDALRAGTVAAAVAAANVAGEAAMKFVNPLAGRNLERQTHARNLFGSAGAAAQSMARDVTPEVVAVAVGAAGSVVGERPGGPSVMLVVKDDESVLPLSARTTAADDADERKACSAPAAVRKPGGGGAGERFKAAVKKVKETSAGAVKIAQAKAAVGEAELELAMAQQAVEEGTGTTNEVKIAQAKVLLANTGLELAQAEEEGVTGMKLTVAQAKVAAAQSQVALAIAVAEESETGDGVAAGAGIIGDGAGDGHHHASLMGGDDSDPH